LPQGRVQVVRCPTDGIVYCMQDGVGLRLTVKGWSLVPPEQIGGAHLIRCWMCGNFILVGPDGIYDGKCENCGLEDYVVNYKGRLICAPCLYGSVKSQARV
jgi:hypothetical protein